MSAIADRKNLKAALYYARHNIPVFPIWPVLPKLDGNGFLCRCGNSRCSSPGKHPHAKLAPHGCHDATMDPRTIEMWWAGDDLNIGGVMGNLYAIDIDPKNGGDLSVLEKRFGPMPRSWRARTGGGGQHLLFHSTDPDLGNTAGTLARGVDTRGRGGYVVLPPSNHLSGRSYAWQEKFKPWKTELAPLPSLITEALKEHTHTTPTSPAEWCDITHKVVPVGERNATLTKLAGRLLRHDIGAEETLWLLRAWNCCYCEPPLADNDVVQIVNSICCRELKRRSNGYG